MAGVVQLTYRPTGTYGIAPVMVPLAALGLVMLMVGAVITRIRRHEAKFMVADLVYLDLAAFVAWAASAPSPSPADPARHLAAPARSGSTNSRSMQP